MGARGWWVLRFTQSPCQELNQQHHKILNVWGLRDPVALRVIRLAVDDKSRLERLTERFRDGS